MTRCSKCLLPETWPDIWFDGRRQITLSLSDRRHGARVASLINPAKSHWDRQFRLAYGGVSRKGAWLLELLNNVQQPRLSGILSFPGVGPCLPDSALNYRSCPRLNARRDVLYTADSRARNSQLQTAGMCLVASSSRWRELSRTVTMTANWRVLR